VISANTESLETGDTCEVTGKLDLRWDVGAFREHGNQCDPLLESRQDLHPYRILWIVQWSLPTLRFSAGPTRADDDQEHVARSDHRLDGLAPVDSSPHGVGVYKDGGGTEALAEPVREAVYEVRDVSAPVADEDILLLAFQIAL
jgi:hypothetical protein